MHRYERRRHRRRLSCLRFTPQCGVKRACVRAWMPLSALMHARLQARADGSQSHPGSLRTACYSLAARVWAKAGLAPAMARRV